MDWIGWGVFGLVATAALTSVLIAAQLAGWTRLDLPLLLGTLVVEDPDRARAVGFLLHLCAGQVFALLYALGFAALGMASWWIGALFGLVHAGIALTAIIPLFAGVNPRIGSVRGGPESRSVLEPPGLLALNYGYQSPLVAAIAHILYGALLGLLLEAG